MFAILAGSPAQHRLDDGDRVGTRDAPEALRHVRLDRERAERRGEADGGGDRPEGEGRGREQEAARRGADGPGEPHESECTAK